MSVVLGYDLRRKDLDYELLRKLTAEARTVAAYYYGDYLPADSVQRLRRCLDRLAVPPAGDGHGTVEAFRRPRSSRVDPAVETPRSRRQGGLRNEEFRSARARPAPSGRDLMEQGLPCDVWPAVLKPP